VIWAVWHRPLFNSAGNLHSDWPFGWFALSAIQDRKFNRARSSIRRTYGAIADGRPFRVCTVVDQWSRWSPVLEVGSRMGGDVVAAALDRAIARQGKPQSITGDHGTEFMSRALEDWASRRGVPLDVTRPGTPTDRSCIESSNGTLRDACSHVHQGVDLAAARRRIKAWRIDR